MTNDKIPGLLGFCRKAGKLVAGTEKVTALIKTGQRCLVMLAEDISAKTEKELVFLAQSNNAVVIRLGFATQMIAHATGTTAGVFATADEGFSKAILQGGNNI